MKLTLEWLLKKSMQEQLVLAHRIIAMWGYDESTYTHCSVREATDAFWIKQQSDLFSQVTVDNLCLYNTDGQMLQGDMEQHNVTGQSIHHAIYKYRKDTHCVVHLHSPASVAVSAEPQGLMMLSQWALHFYQQIAYHDYNALAIHKSDGEAIVQDLEDKSICLLRNHGYIIAARSVPEALFFVHHLEHACQTQAMMSEAAKRKPIPDQMCQKAVQDLLSFEPHLGVRDMLAYCQELLKKRDFECSLELQRE